jgi:prepilin-type N-terminal cleavage/methylation domain-containing protein/prepilin-type processing-associated H-X9-DG protein
MCEFQASDRRRGFTILELLVVIAIIGMLVALLLPAIQMAREAGRRATCWNNLKQLAIAAHHYDDVYNRFPTGARPTIDVGGRPIGGTNLWVALLPYLEQDNLYNQWNYDDNRYNVAGGRNAIQAQIIEVLICPSDRLPQSVVHHTAATAPPWSWGFYGLSSYGGSAGNRSMPPGPPPAFRGISRDGIYFIDSCVRSRDVIDGHSNTILFGERYHHDPDYDLRQPVVLPGIAPIAEIGKWGMVAGPGGQAVMGNVTLHTAVPINYRMPSNGSLEDLNNRNCAFGSGHPGGANFAFADGSVRFVRDSIALDTLQALSTRGGGEAVADSDF